MIKIDMEMPESCMKCPLSPENWVYATCKIAGKAVWLTKRPDWCPLIEVEAGDGDNKKLKYERLREEINGWPDWKKKAYNEMFATSEHSEKLEGKKSEYINDMNSHCGECDLIDWCSEPYERPYLCTDGRFEGVENE